MPKTYDEIYSERQPLWSFMLELDDERLEWDGGAISEEDARALIDSAPELDDLLEWG